MIKTLFKNIILIGIIVLFSVSKANGNTISSFNGGMWQSIIDGQPGEGSLFYILNFDTNGTLTITKQGGGFDNVVEVKSWKQIENTIVINSNAKDKITEFNGSTLEIVSDNIINYSSGYYKGIIKPSKPVFAWIHLFLILVVLILLNELFRRSKWATIIFYVLIPIILTPLVWTQHDVTYWFKWVKLYSVVFAVVWFSLIRYTSAGKHNWVKLVAALFLAVNIVEAVSQDLSMGYLPNILNGIAGILNIITLFYGWKMIGPDNSKQKDMVWPGMTTFWIIAYDIWNIVYVYLNFPGSTSVQIMVILSCTLPAIFIKKGTWLQARGFTLAAWFMYYFTFPRFTEQLEVLVPRSNNLMITVAVISIAANIAYFFVFVKMIRKK